MTTTMLQLLQAYSAVLSDGTMVRPYVIDSIVSADQRVLYQGKTQVVGNPINATTAKKLQELMSLVVNEEGALAVGIRLVILKSLLRRVPLRLQRMGHISMMRASTLLLRHYRQMIRKCWYIFPFGRRMNLTI